MKKLICFSDKTEKKHTHTISNVNDNLFQVEKRPGYLRMIVVLTRRRQTRPIMQVWWNFWELFSKTIVTNE